MSRFDDAVDQFIVSRFVGNEGRFQYLDGEHKYRPDEDGLPSEITVLQADMGWDCGCYSSYTRDDTFEITALIKTKSREIQFSYGNWGDFPSLITDLDEYINNYTCSVENRE
ncbi:MAG TPA: hypothetical protein VIY48_09150 [Candidatus Paceibacterota bacterium]